MLRRVLVANRGEIAARIVRTCRRMGVGTVAVYASDDASAPHVRLADQAIALGDGPPSRTYLDIQRILAAARDTGCDAVHPGYGFLSERADFAHAVLGAGLVWVGPPPAAIERLGDKSHALRLARELGVPVTPGSDGPLESMDAAADLIEEIGTPAVLKAVHGGGGMGMVRIDDPSQLADAWGSARQQARAAFGSDEVILERWWERPRHVEVQVALDEHGNAVHLFERECSVQRRHQKLIEEGPAPCVDAELREALTTDALAIARAAGVTNLATVEFLVHDGGYVFNEVNPRLQVEHPVTEAITGQDLVEWQLRIAAGEPLPRLQGELSMDGWAVECRINVEDALDGFRPAPGRVTNAHVPAAAGLRVDHAIVPGGQVAARYDSLIAKVIAHGPDRATAIERCRSGLAELRIGGVPTTSGILHHILGMDSVRAGELHTGILDAAVVGAYADIVRQAAAAAIEQWTSQESGTVVVDGHDLDWRRGPKGFVIDGVAVMAPSSGPHRDIVEVAGRSFEVQVRPDLPRPTGEHAAAAHRVESPLPGVVVELLVEAGQAVERGDPLVVIDAMKMRNKVQAPADGVVDEVVAKEGQQVAKGDELVRLGPGQ